MSKNVYLVEECPEHGVRNIDSVWDTRQAAEARLIAHGKEPYIDADHIDITVYRLNEPDGYVPRVVA